MLQANFSRAGEDAARILQKLEAEKKGRMRETEFWDLIAATKLESVGDNERQVELLQKKLESFPEVEILDFYRLLDEQMNKSYTRDLWAAAYIINGGCSNDGFDYFRAWLIAQGKEVFEAALEDPETLTDVAETEADMELFIYAAAEAYEKKTDKKFPYPSSGLPELTGDEWEEADLPTKYPKLSARFSGTDQENGVRGGLGMVADLLRGMGAGNRSGVSEAENLFQQAVIQALDETPESLKKAATLLQQSAEMGHAGAQYLLGLSFKEGRGVHQNFLEAAKLYRQAAENGNADACAALAELYHQGQELDQDLDEAFKWYSKGAELGCGDAEFGLGVMYSEGEGVKQDLEEGFKWFHRAAKNGHASAALNVGTHYLFGKGVDADAAEAFKWFVKAAEAGSARARYNLGALYEKGQGVEQDFSKAVEMYEIAAKEAYDRAMLNLGVMYSNGKGVAQDDAKAAEWYQRAVDAGNTTALSNLAVLYQNGRGVPQDINKAVSLHRQSAESGVAVGQFNLGSLYQRGIGVKQDYKEALKWYRLAAEQNQASALNNIGDIYENGYGVKQDYAEAAKWYHRAAERGISVSAYSLGKFYRDGLGVKQDYREAEKWLKIAVEKRFEKAAPLLEALYTEGRVKRPEAASETKSPEINVAKLQSESIQKIVSAQSAAQRALCLRALIQRSKIEAFLVSTSQTSNPLHNAIANAGAFQNEAAGLNERLKDKGLWMALSRKEKKLLDTPPGSWSANLLNQVSWRSEAMGVIAWALGLEKDIRPYDSQWENISLVRSLDQASVKDFVSGAKLRDEAEILRAREIAENWLWRARTTQIQKEPDKYPPPPGMTFEKIIAMAAEHWEKDGLFKAVRGDYPALGKAYSELTEDEWLTLRSIATERLYGLNWLCKYSAHWDSVPTGT